MISGLSTITDANQTIYGLWNTTAGGDSNAATAGSGVGNYVAAESPPNAFDLNTATKYNSYGPCTASSAFSVACGLNTGAYFTPSGGSSLLQSLRFCTANDSPNRDPITVTVEGSNQPSSALTFGSSWSLIYNGSTGLDTDPGRYTYGITQNISNSVWYLSYRILVTSKRNVEDSVQYAEVQLIGY
jgi:hypothetical protein